LPPERSYIILAVTQESGNLWRYNLSGRENNQRVAYGKIIMPDYTTVLRRAAESAWTDISLALSSEACSTHSCERRYPNSPCGLGRATRPG
jgi:hypothetical protein